MSEWISVKDRLPEEWGTNSEGYTIEFLVAVEGKYIKQSWYEGGGVWDYTEVSHWMPLPEPPE